MPKYGLNRKRRRGGALSNQSLMIFSNIRYRACTERFVPAGDKQKNALQFSQMTDTSTTFFYPLTGKTRLCGGLRLFLVRFSAEVFLRE
jgi:hypothetical protein